MECAEMVLFLVTDHGKWITGQALNVEMANGKTLEIVRRLAPTLERAQHI